MDDVVVAGPEDRVSAVATLVDAFVTDPFWGWLFSDPEHQRAQIGTMFTQFFDSAVSHGWIHATAEFGAVTLWRTPDSSELDVPLAEDASFLAALRAASGEDFSRAYDCFLAFEDHHVVDAPHYYLDVFGTHGAHRGQGVGMKLLAHDLALIDAEHQPCYLESTNPANLVRYERVGFMPLTPFPMPHGGPEVTPMWRPAR